MYPATFSITTGRLDLLPLREMTSSRAIHFDRDSIDFPTRGP